MAIIELTLEQIIEAARQLPQPERKRLLWELQRRPAPAKARSALRRARRSYRMSTLQRKRLSELLLKGNAGTLSAEEGRELERLVSEFEQRTLDMARSVLRGSARPGSRRRGASA